MNAADEADGDAEDVVGDADDVVEDVVGVQRWRS